MDFYSNLSSQLVLKPFTSGAQGSSPPQPPWLSRPKEERPLLRPNTSGTPFNLGGPGSYPRRDSITRLSLGAHSNSESSIQSSSSAIDPYSSPITAEDLKNRFMRDVNNSATKIDEKLPEKTYMSSSPNPFLVNSFLKRQGSFLGQRPSSSSSIPNSVQASIQNESRNEPRRGLVDTGVLKPRRATTATSRFHSIDLNSSNSSIQSNLGKGDGSSMHPPSTNPTTMFSVMTKRPPQRMVEHSTSVFSNPQSRPILANGKVSNPSFTSSKQYGSYNDISAGLKENGDGAELRELVVEREDFRAESMKMPVTGTVTSNAIYPRSSKCEELIFRPQTEKDDDSNNTSNFGNYDSESLYDRVKREVENHRRARQIALEREKEMDDRQKQLIQSKFTPTSLQKDFESEIKTKPGIDAATANSRFGNSSSEISMNSTTIIKQKPPMVPVKESVPVSLSSNAGSLQKAILPNRIVHQAKSSTVEISSKPIRKASIDRSNSYTAPKPRLSVTTRGSTVGAIKKGETCDDEAAELGERQPGDGEAEIGEDDRTIHTEYSRSTSVNSVATDPDVNDPPTDVDDDDDDIDSDSSADSQSRPISRQSNASSRASSTSGKQMRKPQTDSDSDDDLDDDSDDDDVDNMNSSSDDDSNVASRSHSRASSRRSRSMSAIGVRRAKSRSKSTASSSDEDEDDDDDDGKSTKSSALRRSRSVTRVNISSGGQGNKVISKEKTSQIKAGLTRIGTARKNKGLNPLIYSHFDYVPPCIRFVVDGDTLEQLPWKYRKLLIWRMSTLTPIIVKQTIWRSGFRASKLASVIDDLETHDTNDWIGYFGKHMRPNNFKCLREYQKYNHYPGSHQLGRKDRLWQNLHHMQQSIGKKEYNFFPQTFCLPMDSKLLKKAWDDDGGHKMKWILKPPASARGQGIRVVHQWCQIPKKSSIIVQKYLSRPYLINESKFDLRVYVYVPSFDPLRIYIHEDGLVRFASQKYSNSVKNLANRFMHLTNYSINKQNTDYQSNSDDSQCQGHKWSLRALWSYMRRKGHNTDKIWDQIKDIIVKTIISVESHINTQVKLFCRRKYCVHELFGFDILLDESLQPWVLECNISPSLHSNSKLDINIKGEMIKDMFNIAGFQIPDKLESGAPPASYSPSSELVCDRRLWYCELGSDEKAKQNYFITKAEQGLSLNSILDIVTPEDLRILVESVDESSRAGSFQMVYPTANTRRYLKFFEKPRYANLLLQTYAQRFNGKEKQGITWLNSMCQRKIHLQQGSKELRHRWRPTSGDNSNKKTSSTSNMSSTSQEATPYGDHSS